jgi:O-acetyl-ADP-ribose deacetylase
MLPTLQVIEGDLFGQPVEAIVNAANPSLLGTGGISGAILERGGTALTEEIRRRYPCGASTGQAVETSAPNMYARHVIHAVPPDFNRVGQAEGERLLRATYRSALAEADRLGLMSVAFPLLSGGIFRGEMDLQRLQAIAVETLTSTATTRVRFVYLVLSVPASGRPKRASRERGRKIS